MDDLIDISRPLSAGMPCWPGSVGLRLTRTSDMERGDPVTNSRLDLDVHVGTHVDAPAHFLPGTTTVERMPLDALIGPAWVIDARGRDAIEPDLIEELPSSARRVLFRTRNSDGGQGEFQPGFVALTTGAAEGLAARGIRLVGVDGPSVQRFGDTNRTHEVLLEREVILLEGLDLSRADPGEYELLCLPLNLVGAEGAPARAVLRRLGT